MQFVKHQLFDNFFLAVYTIHPNFLSILASSPLPLIPTFCLSTLFMPHKAPNKSTWNSEFLMGYRLRYRREVQTGDTVNWRYKYANGQFGTVQYLKAGARYSVNVQAYNFLGGGPWSLGASTYMEIGIFTICLGDVFFLFVSVSFSSSG